MTNQMKGIYNPLLNERSSEKEQHYSGMTMWFKECLANSKTRWFVAFKDEDCTKIMCIGLIPEGCINFD